LKLVIQQIEVKTSFIFVVELTKEPRQIRNSFYVKISFIRTGLG
jgi:hypothetical protein